MWAPRSGLLHADLSVERLRTGCSPPREPSLPPRRFRPADSGALASSGRTAAASVRATASTFVTAGRPISSRCRSRAGVGVRARGVLARFRAVYQTTYGVAQDAPAELVTYRVRATCPSPRPGQPLRHPRDCGRVPQWSVPGAPRSRPIDGGVMFPVFRHADLASGVRLTGPAFVEGPESTTLVPPDVELTVDMLGTMHLRPEGKDSDDELAARIARTLRPDRARRHGGGRHRILAAPGRCRGHATAAWPGSLICRRATGDREIDATGRSSPRESSTSTRTTTRRSPSILTPPCPATMV